MRVNTHSITHGASVPSADSTSGDPQADKTRGTRCSPTQVLSPQHNKTCSPTFIKKHIFFLVSEKLGIPFTHISKIQQKPKKRKKIHISQLSFCFSSVTRRVTYMFLLSDAFFSVVTVLLAINAALPEWNSYIIADQDSGAILANGIIFNHVTKILLAEKLTLIFWSLFQSLK